MGVRREAQDCGTCDARMRGLWMCIPPSPGTVSGPEVPRDGPEVGVEEGFGWPEAGPGTGKVGAWAGVGSARATGVPKGEACGAEASAVPVAKTMIPMVTKTQIAVCFREPRGATSQDVPFHMSHALA